jgi:prolyl oligopeptidase
MRELLLGQLSSYSGVRSRRGLIFAIKDQPPKQQPFLVVREAADDTATERTIVDPNEIDPSGKTTIDMFVPSRKGRIGERRSSRL